MGQILPLGSLIKKRTVPTRPSFRDSCFTSVGGAGASFNTLTTVIPLASYNPTVNSPAYSGAEGSFVVAQGVTELIIDMAGARGGSDRTNNAGIGGGLGTRVQGRIPVNAGDVIAYGVGGMPAAPTTNIGAAGGFTGGAAGGTQSTAGGDAGGGGGGYSYIKRNGTTVLVAGAGGAVGGSVAGVDAPATLDTEATATSAATVGTNQTLGPAGGGGGGGWRGGIGGAGGTGGRAATGGTSMAHSTLAKFVTVTAGYQAGNGYVTFSDISDFPVTDYAVAVAVVPINVTLTPPNGWELLRTDGHPGSVGGIPKSCVYIKKLVIDDVGVGQQWTTDVATAYSVGISVYKNVGSLGVAPTAWWMNIPRTVNHDFYYPSQIPKDYDLTVFYSVASPVTLNALANAQITTPPDWSTVRVNTSSQVNSTSKPYGVHIGDGICPRLTSYEAILGSQCNVIGGMLTLCPVTEPSTVQAPKTLVGQPLHVYGTSMVCRTNDTQNSDGHNKNAISTWPERIRRKLMPSSWNNLGVIGSEAPTICNFAYGQRVLPTQGNKNLDGSLDYTCVQQIGTWYAQTGRTGFVICDPFGNNALRDGSNGVSQALNRLGAKNAAISLCKLFRSSSRVINNDASITYTGAWSSAAHDDASGGIYTKTQTPGDKLSFQFTGTDLDLVVIGYDSASANVTGATYDVKVDGVKVTSGTTNNQMRQPSNLNQTPWCQVSIPVYNMGAGTHTIELIHTGLVNQFLTFDCYLVPSNNPPWILMDGPQHVPDATYGAGSSEAQFDIFTQIAKDVADSFPDGRVVFYNPNASGLYDCNTMTGGDATHLNEIGNSVFFTEIMSELKARIP